MAVKPFSPRVLLKRKHFDRLVFGLQAFSVFVAVGCFLLLVNELFLGSTHTAAAILKLQNEVRPIKAQKSPSLTGNKPDPVRRDVAALEKLVALQDPPKPPATPPPAVVQTKSNFSLVGTFVSTKDPKSSTAIIEDTKKGLQDAFSLNEEIFGEAKLLAISRDKVEIERGGQREILTLEEENTSGGDSGGAPSGAEQVVVDERELDNALANLPLLLTQARAVPYFKDGQAQGLRLFAIKTDSLFEKVGLKNGDILKTINGNNLGDFSEAMRLFEKLKAERSISLLLERNREEKTIHYTIR